MKRKTIYLPHQFRNYEWLISSKTSEPVPFDITDMDRHEVADMITLISTKFRDIKMIGQSSVKFSWEDTVWH